MRSQNEQRVSNDSIRPRELKLLSEVDGGIHRVKTRQTKIRDRIGHSHLGQLCQFADILPTYVKVLNVMVRGYRHNRSWVRHTKRDAARYETTKGDIRPRI